MPDTDVPYTECNFCEQPILPTDAVWIVKMAHFVGLEKHYGSEVSEAHADCAQRVSLTTQALFETYDRMGAIPKGCDCPDLGTRTS